MPVRAENRDRYPADWPDISRRIRFQRAAGRCECDGRCGTDHGGRCPALNGRASPLTGSHVVLTVAHLDHQPENCSDDNLMAACQACHLRYDAMHHAQTRAATLRAAAEAAGQLTLDTYPEMAAHQGRPSSNPHGDNAMMINDLKAAAGGPANDLLREAADRVRARPDLIRNTAYVLHTPLADLLEDLADGDDEGEVNPLAAVVARELIEGGDQ